MGRLEMWVEIIPKKDAFKIQPAKIEPPPRYELELRAIVWQTVKKELNISFYTLISFINKIKIYF